MQRSILFGLCLIVCAAILGAGCTSSSGAGSAPAARHCDDGPVSECFACPLALTPADVPAGLYARLGPGEIGGRDEHACKRSRVAAGICHYIFHTGETVRAGRRPSPRPSRCIPIRAQPIWSPLFIQTSEQQKGLVFSDLAQPATGDRHPGILCRARSMRHPRPLPGWQALQKVPEPPRQKAIWRLSLSRVPSLK